MIRIYPKREITNMYFGKLAVDTTSIQVTVVGCLEGKVVF